MFLCGKSHFRAKDDMCRGVKVGEAAAVRIVEGRYALAKKTFKKKLYVNESKDAL